MLISPLRDEDMPAVLAIERASFPSPWTEAMFHSVMANTQVSCWVARIGESVAGYSVFGVAADECDLLNIAVAANVRHKGVATFLMQRMVDYARPMGVTAIWLDVRVTNRVAQGLYRKFGFVAAGTRKGYYQREREAPPSWRGEDALVMVLRIDSRLDS